MTAKKCRMTEYKNRHVPDRPIAALLPKPHKNIFCHHNEPSAGSNAAVSDTFHPVPWWPAGERESPPNRRRQWQQNATPTSPTLRSHSVSVSVEHCYAARASFLRFSDPVRSACDPISVVTRRDRCWAAVCAVSGSSRQKPCDFGVGADQGRLKGRLRIVFCLLGVEEPAIFFSLFLRPRSFSYYLV